MAALCKIHKRLHVDSRATVSHRDIGVDTYPARTQGELKHLGSQCKGSDVFFVEALVSKGKLKQGTTLIDSIPLKEEVERHDHRPMT